ncbi:hypothetical protein KGA66_09750 [Actinocrinis puniceicyclus]|uniref:Uncharacterized protein n=1 Tax=Actinocrinis puniceicyclus TaxID=977794 RepID=A0A8J7WP16_9ACTN|nr:hypothetical protein [Actinocrinis puniceicyclus]MBS2963329.1 hypothetical protein [Actinocrinis puniceicyclus]
MHAHRRTRTQLTANPARTRVSAVLLAAALVAGTITAGAGVARADTAAPTPPDFPATQVDPTVIAAETAASAKAKTTGSPVTVDAETDTGTLVTANPDGSLTRTQTSAPVRTKQNGAWVPIDTTLSVRTDGTIRPAATATGVAFSDGGDGPMATLTQGTSTLSFTFPSALPAPTLSGATATYPDVLPEVDLQLTANAGGFSQLLVVHSAAAAANPTLDTLTLAVKAVGVNLSSTQDGGAAATDASGTTVFHTDTATMWDSAGANGAPASAATAATGSTLKSSAATAPNSGDHVARVQVAAATGSETLTPDRTLLGASDTKYPVYIDPAWSGNPSQLHWARVSSNGWNIYDSTSTATGDHPRVGYDNWPGGAGEVARTFYNMNTGGSTGTSGIGGATVTAATMYINDDWAASSSATPVDLYDCTRPVNNGWNSADLNWSNQPLPNVKQDERTSYETSSGTVSPGTLAFNMLDAAQSAASGDWPDITFVVRAPNESDNSQWKQFASGGGATISITYFRAPYLSGTYTTTPGITNSGTFFATSGYVTMSALGGDTDGENVRSGYEIWNWANGTNTTNVANSLFTSYTATGGAYTYSGNLPDGTYAWRGVTESQDGGQWSGWSPWQLFTVDTSTPQAPGVESPQFPANQFGAAYTDTGSFTMTVNGTDNVSGYMFALDNDLGTTVYNPASLPPTWSGGTITPAKTYWAAAVSVGGPATVSFAPLTVGPHRLFVKAVDQAANTSAETTYLFYAGLTSPVYVYGDQLVNGCAINTCNGNTVTVPAATATVTAGASIIAQSNCCYIVFADGKQAMLANGSGSVAVGDSATLSFYLPKAGYWDFGANLTQSGDYGKYNLTLDQSTNAYSPLLSGFDASSSHVTTRYQDFGTVKDNNGNPVQLSAGLHTVTLTITGKNAASGGYQAGIDALRLAPMSATCAINNLTNCLNNIAISSDSNHGAADADGYGNSFSAGDLAAAGWNASTSTTHNPITVNGAPMYVPAYAVGTGDNILSSGQTVTVPSSGYANTGNAVEFLAFGTMGAVTGATGQITYAGTCGQSSAQAYTLDQVPDWVSGPASAADITFPHRNLPGAGQDTKAPKFYAISVPLVCPGQAITSISLPVVTNKTLPGVAALHIMGIGIRASSYTDSSLSSNWTGSFAAKQDSTMGTWVNQTLRLPVTVTVGNGSSGGKVRLHLSNALGTAAASFLHVSVALQDPTAGGANASAAPVPVTFNNNASITLPAGGEIVSDPVTLTVPQQSTLLVSIDLGGTVNNSPAHAAAQTTSYATAQNTGDHTTDTAATNYTVTMSYQPYLTGVDVLAPGATSGSLVLFGDQTINSDTAAGNGKSHLSDDIAAALANQSQNNGTVPYGVLNEGQNSWTAGNNLLPALSGSSNQYSPLNAMNPADRYILDNANVRTVLISTGTADILAGDTAGDIENKLAALSQQVRHYYTDDVTDYSVNINNLAGLLTVYIATIPPDPGANSNTGLTAAQEQVREYVNNWILGTSDSYAAGNADGVIDFAAALSSTGTDAGTTVNPAYLWTDSNGNVLPSTAYYQQLAQQYLINTAAPPATTGTVRYRPMALRAS